MPSREEILAWLADHPEHSAKRDLSRAFGVRGDARVPFKALLREMQDEGLIAGAGRRFHATSGLPSVGVIDIPLDADPEALIGHPAKWDETDGARPAVEIETPKNARVVPGPGDRILARIGRREVGTSAYAARAMKILDKPAQAMIGIVRKTRDGGRLVPVDRKLREMTIRAEDLGGARDGDLVEIEPVTAGRTMDTRARVTSVIGNPLSEKAVSLIALHKLDIPYRFSDAALAEAEAAKAAGLQGREDWRDIPFVTIDPEDAKDHDDAVFARPDADKANPGGFEVFVAIADVAYYVRPGSALDRDAYLRGNSVYFPDRVVPMLPERISNDLCSLRQSENRAAMAARMVIGANGEKRTHDFHRVLIRSAAKLSYLEAQQAIDGRPDEAAGPLLEPVLKPLWAAFAAMATAREKRQPLALDLPERRIRLNERGLVEDVYVPDRLEAHRLIEEMMIAANVCAAETLEGRDTPLLYRVHDSPSLQKLEGLREALKTMQLSLVKDRSLRPLHFNQILDRAGEHSSPELINELVLRAQAQAEYADENYGHFGLNLRRYAHFTSPNRRYADLIVHRALIRALGFGPDGLPPADEKKLAGMGQHISMTERRAMAAERETQDRLLALYLSDKVGETFEGRISGVTRSGLFVALAVTGADGFVPASTLGRDYFRFVEAEMAMIGDRTDERFRVGDPVQVRLLEAAPMAGALRFEIISEGARVTTKGRGAKPSGKRQAPRRRKSGPKRKKTN
ncbi:MAG TPA: ribonuclease R [Devosiaceae bacterium]|nr:ribonuclease R [Devosiaceae bacterium]